MKRNTNTNFYIPGCITTMKPGCVALFRGLLAFRHSDAGVTK